MATMAMGNLGVELTRRTEPTANEDFYPSEDLTKMAIHPWKSGVPSKIHGVSAKVSLNGSWEIHRENGIARVK